MALKIKIPWLTGNHPWAVLALRVGLLTVAAVTLVFFLIFGYFYIAYRHIVDDRLKEPIFANTAKIYAAPREVRPGQKFTVRPAYKSASAVSTSPVALLCCRICRLNSGKPWISASPFSRARPRGAWRRFCAMRGTARSSHCT